MIYDDALGYHYEEFGILFSLYILLYILNPIVFIAIARKKLKKLK